MMSFILETQILTYNKSETERLESLGVKNTNLPNLEAWFPFVIDLRCVVALKPPGLVGDEGIPNLNETVLYTAWDSFVVQTPYEKVKAQWLDVKLYYAKNS